jgi:hypothetical protein
LKNKTKVIAMVAPIVFILVLGVLISLSTVSAEEPEDTQSDRRQIGRSFRRRVSIGRWIIRRGTPETLIGEVSAVEGRILVLDVEGSKVNVIVPKRWIIDGGALNIKDLFNGQRFSLGDEVTLETLKVEFEGDAYKVKIYFAHSIQTDGQTASALLPFNIETE